MKNKIIAVVAVLLMAIGMTAGLVENVGAEGVIDCCGTKVFGNSCPEELNHCGPEQNEDFVLAKIRKVITVLTVVVGVISSVVIVIAGINYMTAAGDPAKIVRSRTAIIAAIIGLVISICAYAITALVVGALTE